MKSIFVLTQAQTGPAGHGEPGTPYLTLKTDRKWYELGKPAPAFSTKEKAEDYRNLLDYPSFWTITELPLI